MNTNQKWPRTSWLLRRVAARGPMLSSRITGVVSDHEDARNEGRSLHQIVEHSPQAGALDSPLCPPDDPLGVCQVQIVSDVGGYQGEGLVQCGSTIDEVGGDFPDGTEHRARHERRKEVPPEDRQGCQP